MRACCARSLTQSSSRPAAVLVLRPSLLGPALTPSSNLPGRRGSRASPDGCAGGGRCSGSPRARTFLERPLSLPGACQADLLWLASNPFWTAAPLEPLFRSLHSHGAQRLLKYAHRTLCCRYACLKAAAAKRRARHADGSADDAVAMCSASRPWRCLACTSAIPISSSQRSRATSWLLPTRHYATSRADRSKRTSTHRLHAFTVTHLIKLEELRVM